MYFYEAGLHFGLYLGGGCTFIVFIGCWLPVVE